MIVGVAEIKALTAGWPINFALDLDSLCDQVLFPGCEITFRDSEREVQLSCGLMRRDHAAGGGKRFRFAAAFENEENLLIRHAEDAESFVGFDQPKSQPLLVEANRAGKIIRVEAGFDNAVDVWRRRSNFSSRFT